MTIDQRLFQKCEQILNRFDYTITDVVDNHLVVATKNARFDVQVKIPATMDAVHRFCNAFFFENVRTDSKALPKCIKRRDRATIVEWEDGTQTKIVRSADDDDAGLYIAFCIALAKKMYGNNSALKRAISDADEERQLYVLRLLTAGRKKRHEERMKQQLKRSNARIARLARRAFKREALASLVVSGIAIEEDYKPC